MKILFLPIPAVPEPWKITHHSFCLRTLLWSASGVMQLQVVAVVNVRIMRAYIRCWLVFFSLFFSYFVYFLIKCILSLWNCSKFSALVGKRCLGSSAECMQLFSQGQPDREEDFSCSILMKSGAGGLVIMFILAWKGPSDLKWMPELLFSVSQIRLCKLVLGMYMLYHNHIFMIFLIWGFFTTFLRYYLMFVFFSLWKKVSVKRK